MSSSSPSPGHKPVSDPARSTASTSKRRSIQDLGRSKSLRLPSQPLNIPIPPSLLQSPHLHSPQSIFRRAVSTPRMPSEEDEEWLQDTVPLSLEMRDGQRKKSTSSPLSKPSNGTNGEEQSRGRSSQSRVPSNAPPSPPLVRWSRDTPSPLAPSTPWLSQTKTRSEPNMSRHAQTGYFVGQSIA